MNHYYYPLMLSGSLLALWIGQPAQASDPNAVPENPFDASVIFEGKSESEAKIPKEKGLNSSVILQEEKNSFFAQTLPPTSEVQISQPEIIIQEQIEPATQDYLTPQTPSAPVLPRAIAPPVGDMAVSNINTAASRISLGTNLIIPRLVLQDAPAGKVLEVLAEYAGLNLIYNVSAAVPLQGEAPAEGGGGGEATVTLNFTNESLENVFNTVLTVSGLKANRQGRTIYVGANLPTEALNLISRTLRLNQVKSFNAGTFLASQGAEFQRLVTVTEDITDPLTGRVIGRRDVPANLEAITPAVEGATGAPLLLTGLRVSADDRLNAITLVGEPRQVEVATSLLTQLDARRRQVAINVKVVDVNLNNVQDFDASFSFGINDSFFIQDNGAATIRFGSSNPAGRNTIDFLNPTGQITNPPTIPNPFANGQILLDTNGLQVLPTTGQPDFNPFAFQQNNLPGLYYPGQVGITSDPSFAGIAEFEQTITRDPATGISTIVNTVTRGIPSYFQYPQQFLALINAQIQSNNAKVLTDPTLVVQEGQEATVKLTQKVVESVQTSVDPLSGTRTITPVLADAGLTLVVNLDKVDDNGFVNLSVSPTIAAPGGFEFFDSGDGAVNRLTLLNRRELTSGLVRLRDGQTLILSGVIQETDQTITRKVPILGDIPILGALFRSSSDSTQRTEVIIVITPQIMDDNGQFGYNYAPGREAADVLRQRGFQIPSQ